MGEFDIPRITRLLHEIAAERYSPLPVGDDLSADERDLVRALNQVFRDRQSLRAQAADRSRLIIDSTPIAICITNRDHLYEYVNPHYRELTGYAEDELIGQSFLKVVPPDLQPEMAELHDAFMGQRSELGGRWRIVNRDGREIPILASAAYIIDFDGEPKKITFVTDISELEATRASLEREIEERARLEQAREEVERVLRHDLRNPIDGIRTAADYLLHEPLDERSHEFVRLMYDAAIRARNKIDNSLAYTRMQRGQYQISRVRINLVQLVRDVIRGLADALAAYRVEVEPRYRDGELFSQFDVELWGEPDFLMDAIGNLLRNAVEAGRDQEAVRLIVDDTQQTDDGHPLITIAIHNEAVIPPEIRENLFDPYVTHGKSGGTGLGTYTARLVARAHGGDVRVESTPESGTTVTLELPRARPGELA